MAVGVQKTITIVVAAPNSGTYSTLATAYESDVLTNLAADKNLGDNAKTLKVTVSGAIVPTTSVLAGPIYLRDSFGFDPLGNGTAIRYDVAGNPVPVFLTSTINQLRAEWPNTSSEVWMTPSGRKAPTWAFAVASLDPATVEPAGSYDRPGENGVLWLSSFLNNDALLPFEQPSGPVTASASVIATGLTVAIGFTPSAVLTSNFESSGAAWIVLKMSAGRGSVATWELHTNGLNGPSVSGTVVLQNYNPISVSYDPATGTVVGSVQGVATRALPFTVTGVKYVGIQGNGGVNDFLVQAGSITP